MNFTILKINNDSIDVSFDVDGITQNLSGMPLDNVDALNQALFDYGTAYEAGLQKVAKPEVAPEVKALVGQSMELKIDKAGVMTSIVSSIKVTPTLGGKLNAS